jgi:hypothetical protein
VGQSNKIIFRSFNTRDVVVTPGPNNLRRSYGFGAPLPLFPAPLPLFPADLVARFGTVVASSSLATTADDLLELMSGAGVAGLRLETEGAGLSGAGVGGRPRVGSTGVGAGGRTRVGSTEVVGAGEGAGMANSVALPPKWVVRDYTNTYQYERTLDTLVVEGTSEVILVLAGPSGG